MKTRILAIAPYPGMRELMTDVAAGRDDIDLHVVVGDLEYGLQAVQEYSQDYDVIVSRGGTSQLIRRNSDMPVIDVTISVYDVLCAIRSALSMGAPFAVIGYSNLTDCARDLCRIMQYDIRIVTITHDMDVHQLLEDLVAKGINTFVCDMIVSTVATEMGLYAILVLSGVESITQVFNQAVHLAKAFNYIRRQREMLKTIFAVSDQDVLVYYADGRFWFSTMPPAEAQALDAIIRPHIENFSEHSEDFFEIPARDTLHSFRCRRIEAFQETYIMAFHTQQELFHIDNNLNSILLYSSGSGQSTQMAAGISIGTSDLRDKVLRYAKTSYPVFLTGEPGSQKTQIASFLHSESRLGKKHFYRINCPLLSPKKWRFLLKHVDSPLLDVGCTVFFRDVDTMSEQCLGELMDFLTQGSVWESLKLVFSLNSCSAEYPKVLQTLCHALPGIQLDIPPLRARRDDIPSIAIMYLNLMNKELGKNIISFECGAIELLKNYDWPQNFTQFCQVIREAVVMTPNGYILESTIREILKTRTSAAYQNNGATVLNIERPLVETELDVVRMVLEANDMNQTKTAEILGISRSKIWRMLK